MLLTTSPTLAPARHGFSTRRGGVSGGRYATLNVSVKWGDDPALVEENRRRLAQAGGFAVERLYTATQVHGARVELADGAAREKIAAAEADALVATAPGVAVGVYTADCVPILISDGEGRVAAAHAGWRGTVRDVAAAAVEALVAAGARRENLRAALGPSICADCFEVGEEVAAEFARVVPASVRRAHPKPHVDLHHANRVLLANAGVLTERIDSSPPCTRCHPSDYFSFRRDGSNIGQHLSFIVAG